MAAPASPCSANASSSTPDDTGHGIRARARKLCQILKTDQLSAGRWSVFSCRRHQVVNRPAANTKPVSSLLDRQQINRLTHPAAVHSCCPPGRRKIAGSFLGSSSRLRQGRLPAGAASEDMQQPARHRHVIRVRGIDDFPRYRPALSAGMPRAASSQALRSVRWSASVFPDHLRETRTPGACVAEVLTPVCLALAVARPQPGLWVPWLDAIPQPVRARRGTRLIPERVGEPVDVLSP